MQEGTTDRIQLNHPGKRVSNGAFDSSPDIFPGPSGNTLPIWQSLTAVKLRGISARRTVGIGMMRRKKQPASALRDRPSRNQKLAAAYFMVYLRIS
jgi:hypothetical protein